MKRGIPILLCTIASMLLFISNLVTLPRIIIILMDVVLCVGIVHLIHREKVIQWKIILIGISTCSIIWSVWSAYFSPYWNSRTLCDVVGFDCPLSADIDNLLSTELAIDDFEYAIHKVCQIHPALMDSIPYNFRNEYDKQQQILHQKDFVYVYELVRSIQFVLATLKDAHTKAFPVMDSYHYADFSTSDRICAIGGKDIETIINDNQCLISSESKEWSKHIITNKLYSYEGLKSLDLFSGDSVHITYISKNSDTVSKVYHKVSFRSGNPSVNNPLNASNNLQYSIDSSTKSSYLRLEHCNYYTPSQKTNYNQRIQNYFLDVKHNGINTIILDLRGNPGGSPAVAFEFMRYLPIHKIKVGRTYIRRGPIMLIGGGTIKNRQYEDLIFEGQLYVLTSLSTFSGGMNFADYLQGNHLASVVGESPGNTPNCYSNITHFVLPCSKISLNISTTKYSRTDESIVYDELIPDFQCGADDALDFCYDISQIKG